MYLLYERFIEIAKQEQLEKYNRKHRDYLIRSGKIKQEEPMKQALQDQNPSSQNRRRQRQFRKPRGERSHKEREDSYQPIIKDERVIKGSGEYNLNFEEETVIETKPQKGHQNTRFASQTVTQNSFVKIQERKIPTLEASKVETKATKYESSHIPSQRNASRPEPEQMNQFAQIELVECPQNCGRKFNPKALDKHIKICQKGEQKRKVFKVKVVDEQAEKLKRDEPSSATTKKEVPKWKKESQELRNRIQNKQTVDDRVQCPGCGRKFNETAAERHISKCVQRSTGFGRKR